jgi:hypothetical protein
MYFKMQLPMNNNNTMKSPWADVPIRNFIVYHFVRLVILNVFLGGGILGLIIL